MATDLTNTSTPITADGDYDFDVVPGHRVLIKVNFTAGTGTITLKDAQDDAYRNEGDTANLTVTNSSTITAYEVLATGRTVRLTASSMSSASATVAVIDLGP